MLTHETGCKPAIIAAPEDRVSEPDTGDPPDFSQGLDRAPFFESDSHRGAVAAHVAAGVLPLKYAYAGSAAWTHDESARSSGYRSVIGAVDLEVSVVETLDRRLRVPRHVAEIGPGNGVHTVSLLRALHERGFPCAHYTALDFSRTLLDLSSRHIWRAMDPRTGFSAALWDVEAGASPVLEQSRSDGAPLTVCLLGNTIGNVDDPTSVLRNIGVSMRSDDVLLLGVTLAARRTAGETLAPYENEIFRRAALEPLRCAGVDPQDIDFRLHCENGTVIGQAIFRRPAVIAGTAVPARHTVRCFSSRRFRPEQVLLALDPSRWRILHSDITPAGDQMVVAASPRGTGRR
jgi:L-histidine Nalpha-methyltransferase